MAEMPKQIYVVVDVEVDAKNSTVKVKNCRTITRVIDVDWLLRIIDEAYCQDCDNHNGFRCYTCPLNGMIERIKDAPAIIKEEDKDGSDRLDG